MWDRCPWDNGAGCIGRSLRVNAKALKRPVLVRIAKVAPTRTPRVKIEPQPKRLPLAPGDARARRIARSAAYNAAHRPPRPLGECAYCHTRFETRYPGRRRYCSDRCRGRLAREAA